MSWYDDFIPPEVSSIPKLFQGDYEGALQAQMGRGGDYLKKTDEGKKEIRKGYEDAIANLGKVGEEGIALQMQGLDKAEGYYEPAQQRLLSLYGAPGSFRK